MSTPVDILAIGAHPDDVEIGCGGTLLIATDGGASVAVADLTAGEMSTRGTRETRMAERDRATALLGVGTRITMDLPDTRVGMEAWHRDRVVQLIRDLKPRVVLAPYSNDLHPDHAAAGRLAREACFLAGVAKAGTGTPHRPQHLYAYMIHEPFPPSFVIDVTAVWSRRAAAVAVYASQFAANGCSATALSGTRFTTHLRERAGYYGAMVGTECGEPFFSTGPVGLAELPVLESVRWPQPSYKSHP